MLSAQVTAELFGVLLLVARYGAAIMLLPGFGEPYVLARWRLLFALGLAVLTLPVLRPLLPPMPAGVGRLVGLVGGEVLIGLLVGAVARLALAALHLAGMLIAMQSGLAAASIFDPAQASAGSLPGSLLSTAAIVTLFLLDGHHWLIEALARSYTVHAPRDGPALAALVGGLARASGEMVLVGVQIAAPVLVVGFGLNLALGLVNRLVPAMQVFFVGVPLQVLLTLGVVALGFGAAVDLGLDLLQRGVTGLVPDG